MLLPASSVAVQTTVVVPIGNTEPEGGVHTMVGVGSMLSVAVTVKWTTAPEGMVAFTVIGPGTVMTGAVVSAIVRSAWEMSKNTFPSASTLIRACVVATCGISTDCDPSFGVEAASVVG